MKGSVIINGVDIATFGMFILRGGDYDILTMPERKQPKQNNWYEYNGLDVDLSEVFFGARTLRIGFYIAATNARDYEYNLNEFYKLIAPGYITMYSREFDRTFVYRYLSVTEYNHKGGLYKAGDKRGSFTVEFSMDDPLQLFTDTTLLQPRSTYLHTSHVLVNGIDLGAFGIIVNECYSSMLQQSAVKTPLTRSFARRSGLIAYTRQNTTFETRSISIQCTMRARDRSEFYHNYEALFNNISQPGEITIETALGSAACYYSKMEGFKKGIFSHGVMVSFILRFNQI